MWEVRVVMPPHLQSGNYKLPNVWSGIANAAQPHQSTAVLNEVNLESLNQELLNQEFQQDTLVKPQQPNQLFPNITVRRALIDLERAEEVMKQLEQREQEMNAPIEVRVVRPKLEDPVRKPSIEVDTLLAKYWYIGCTPRANFPDTFSLTILERYYQPMTVATPVTGATFTEMADSLTVVSPRDFLQTLTIAETPVVDPGFAYKRKPVDYPSSITIFLTCGLVLLAFIKYNFGKNLSEAFQSFFSYRQSQRMFEERRESDRQAAFLSIILFSLMTGIFISVALPFFGASPLRENYSQSILFFSLATGLLYLLKAMVWRMLGVIFMVQSFAKTYIYNMHLFNRNTGLFIFAPVALIPYVSGEITPYMVYIVIIIFVLSYILKLWRIFKIIHAQNVSLFYFILYLCTLEILPLLLFIKGCKVLCEFTLFL